MSSATIKTSARFEALTAIMFQVEVLWLVKPCNIVAPAVSIFTLKMEAA
jgi:hypothetical protein